MRRRAAAGLLLALLAVCGAGCGSGGGNHSLTVTGAKPGSTATIASAKVARLPVYPTESATTPSQSLANPNENGAPLVALVEEKKGDRLKILLPVRPNGSTGWVSRGQVELKNTDYKIVIELSSHRITVTQGARQVLGAPIAVGTSDTPTPDGKYYIKELLKPPNPNGPYGHYAYGLSGFSNVLTEFGDGNGVIGIHGTNDPSVIGTDVSHGCIRMRNADIDRLVPLLPLGTPVVIRG